MTEVAQIDESNKQEINQNKHIDNKLNDSIQRYDFPVDKDAIKQFVQEELKAQYATLKQKEEYSQKEEEQSKLALEELKKSIEQSVISKISEEEKINKLKANHEASIEKISKHLDKMLNEEKWTEEEYQKNYDLLKNIPFSYISLSKVKSPILNRVINALSKEGNVNTRRLIKYQREKAWDKFEDLLDDVIYKETVKYSNAKKLKEADASMSSSTYTTPNLRSKSIKKEESYEETARRLLKEI